MKRIFIIFLITVVELLSALCSLYYTGKQKRCNTPKLLTYYLFAIQEYDISHADVKRQGA